MIKLYLGNVGSGKTACCVRNMVLNDSKRPTFSNIITRGVKNNHVLNSKMIVKRTIVEPKSGRGQPKILYALNTDFWKQTGEKYGAINVILDEAHTLFNARRSQAKLNQVMTDFLALIRRVLGTNSAGGGDLILISQLDRRIDVIAREMATQVRFHVCHYKKYCKKCLYSWRETNETSEPLFKCPKCGEPFVEKVNHVIEVWHFRNIERYEQWRYSNCKDKTYHKHYLIKDIEKYFPNYSTLQWDNLISEHMDDDEE